MKKMYISISNSRYAEITRKKGNIHFNVNFMPLYDINDSRIIDMFTKGLYFRKWLEVRIRTPSLGG